MVENRALGLGLRQGQAPSSAPNPASAQSRTDGSDTPANEIQNLTAAFNNFADKFTPMLTQVQKILPGLTEMQEAWPQVTKMLHDYTSASSGTASGASTSAAARNPHVQPPVQPSAGLSSASNQSRESLPAALFGVVQKKLSSLSWDTKDGPFLNHLKAVEKLMRSMGLNPQLPSDSGQCRTLLMITLDGSAASTVQMLEEAASNNTADPVWTYSGLVQKLKNAYCSRAEADAAHRALLTMRMAPRMSLQEFNTKFLDAYHHATALSDGDIGRIDEKQAIAIYINGLRPNYLQMMIRMHHAQTAFTSLAEVMNSALTWSNSTTASDVASGDGPVPMEIGAVAQADPETESSTQWVAAFHQGGGERRAGGRNDYRDQRGGGSGGDYQFTNPTTSSRWAELGLPHKSESQLRRLFDNHKCFVCEQGHGGRWTQCPNMHRYASKSRSPSPAGRGRDERSPDRWRRDNSRSPERSHEQSRSGYRDFRDHRDRDRRSSRSPSPNGRGPGHRG